MRTPQEIRDRILALLKERKISPNKMLIECGYNTSLVNDLKKGQMPSADKIANIAKYLGVSTDYLMRNETENDIKQNEKFTDAEEDLIISLRRVLYGTEANKLNENDKKNIVELAQIISRLKSNEK